MGRQISVRLSDDELAHIDEHRPGGLSRAAYLKSLIGSRPADPDVADHAEALAILTAQARNGTAQAAVALERALREEQRAPQEEPDELESLIRTK